MALDKIDEIETAVTQQKAKIILMISDGEDFGDQTEEAAEKVVQSGVQALRIGSWYQEVGSKN